MASNPRPEAPRAERILPGIWRLRLALPWPGVPHGNAWVLAAGDGLVLFDTGIGGGRGRLRNFELALAQVGFAVEDIDLVVCTHSHSDHYGLAAPITAAAGCELWLHPAWEHIRLVVDDPEAALEARLEVARMSGVPAPAMERYRKARTEDADSGVEAIREPDRELLPGVEVVTDHGAWQVYETPGHAPSHVVFHQPESELMITGDHLLGRTVLFFDYGHTADPVGEYLDSLEVVEPLGPNLCLPGHGKPFRDPAVKIAEGRRQVEELRGKARAALADGEHSAFDVVAAIVGPDNLRTPATGFLLQIILAVLDNMAARGEVESLDGAGPKRWALSG
jgi:glyoxylase-like metal-dependent hydrolase (beta-lactamase superfamily II)